MCIRGFVLSLTENIENVIFKTYNVNKRVTSTGKIDKNLSNRRKLICVHKNLGISFFWK